MNATYDWHATSATCGHCGEPGAPERASGDHLHTECIHDARYAEQNRERASEHIGRAFLDAWDRATATTCKLCGATADDEVCTRCREARAQVLDSVCPKCFKPPQVSECGCEVCARLPDGTCCPADVQPDRCLCDVASAFDSLTECACGALVHDDDDNCQSCWAPR